MSAHLDREAVLLHLDRASYFRLNETGQVIWKGVEEGLSRAALARRLTERFDVDPESARAAVDEFLARLSSEGLLEC